ncbi:PucR family transcriptional regulator [Streptomyces sp. NPDC057363]|uniref:PucR family transcriptional regulator n=1 Tax=Streptomyces sp. NPDC057363 TaxID=3346107 RepID=UPI0036273D02
MEDIRPTVQRVLELPEVQRGHPVVLAGRAGLDHDVSWAHVLESSTVAGLLRGGEIVLLTGIGLPHSNEQLRSWVRDLHAAGASAVMIQLGERWRNPPAALVRAADELGLPLIGLGTAVPFVDITRAVQTRIMHSSVTDLRESVRIHELFYRMALEGRTDEEMLLAVASATRTVVVLESPARHVLAFHGGVGDDWEAILGDWERRSRSDGGDEGWLIVDVRARGQYWGRLVALVGPDTAPTARQRLALERGAENIALRRVIEGDGKVLELDTRTELLQRLARGWYPNEAAGRNEAEAAGFPLNGRTVVGVAVTAAGLSPEQLRLAVTKAAALVPVDVLMGADGTGLASLRPDQKPMERLRSLAGRLCRDIGPTTIGLGDQVHELRSIRSSLDDARHAALAEATQGGRRPVVRLADTQVHGLLAQLHRDPRLEAYVERMLGPLLADDHTAELETLRVYLEHGRNKSAAAQSIRLSRPAFYARLHRAGQLLAADLDDADTCLALQVALAARTVTATAATWTPPRRTGLSSHR